MKIQNDALTGLNAAQTSRTEETKLAGQSAYRTGSSSAFASGDSISVSSLASQISDASAAAETRSAERVAKLAALYSRGNYTVDATALSRAMVSRAIDSNRKSESA